jgi:hypothetical protein
MVRGPHNTFRYVVGYIGHCTELYHCSTVSVCDWYSKSESLLRKAQPYCTTVLYSSKLLWEKVAPGLTARNNKLEWWTDHFETTSEIVNNSTNDLTVTITPPETISKKKKKTTTTTNTTVSNQDRTKGACLPCICHRQQPHNHYH